MSDETQNDDKSFVQDEGFQLFSRLFERSLQDSQRLNDSILTDLRTTKETQKRQLDDAAYVAQQLLGYVGGQTIAGKLAYLLIGICQNQYDSENLEEIITWIEANY